ncbi:outer membrane protein [Capnocytophaga haemolytica]|uniref:Outer membrane protein tolC n=1 Tax=Capnocytophaga haemolytica TaxID=45243 RepID=A0AAX2H147_9FLAO|nr:TolC family protein [Capnocytophaga haemolytica]AMD85615.1 transporter [Capnocytophaga haemolytica]SFN88863.1 outer membrane protein [Capnocytophaga haemolytica]SNV16771.1 Outer membrane protein tolC precursor [Capnocytophaga haemolytica]
MMKRLIYLFLLPAIGYSQHLWTLDECISYALEHNISVQRSAVDLKATDIDLLQARGAFLPSVNASAQYGLNEGKNVNPVTNQYENQFFQSASGGVNVELTLFNGLQNWRKLQQAKLNGVAAQYQLDKMKDDIVLSLINAYLEVLSQKEKLKVLQAQLEVSKQSAARTRDLIAAGSLPKGDVYEADATVLGQEQEIIATENALFIAKMGLAQLLLLKEYQSFDVADLPLEGEHTDILNRSPQEIYAKAKEVMREVKIAEANVALAESSLKVSRSGYTPRLSAQWGYNTRWSKSQPEEFWKQLDANKGMFAGLSLNIPILNGFNTLGSVKRQQLNLLKSQFAKEQAELTMEKNIYEAYTDAASAKKLYEASEKTAEAKRQSFAYAEERHKVGLMTTFDYNQAKYQEEKAETDAIAAKYKYLFKVKVLEYYFAH